MKSIKVFKKVLITSLSLMFFLGIFTGFSLAQEEEIRIGALMDLTGTMGQWGTEWLEVGKIAVDEMNKVGGPLDQKNKIIC